jgi:predicted nucleic-acid-binding protein
MRKAILFSWVILAIGWSSVVLAECPQAYPLFRIERSNNKNIVQYDICVSENGDIPDPKPVRAYWILENGQRHDLNFIQTTLAYGIESQERLGENKYRIVVVALKERKIVVEKSPAGYRAIALISGKESILEKAFVMSEERLLGLPKVLYVDLFGRNLQTDVSVTERIIPQ